MSSGLLSSLYILYILDIYGYTLIATSISFISAAAVIYLYVSNKEIQRLVGIELVIILEILDCLLSLTIFIPAPVYRDDHVMCTVQGVALQFCCISEALWTGFMAAHFYWGIKWRKSDPFSLKISLVYISIIALFTALVPMGYHTYDIEGPWCFFDQSNNGDQTAYIRDILFRMLLLYVILWGTFIWNIILYIKSNQIILRNTILHTESTSTIIKYYPIVILFCYLPLSIIRVLEIFDSSIPDGAFILACFCLRLIGLCNALIYGFTDEIKQIICKRHNSSTQSQLVQSLRHSNN